MTKDCFGILNLDGVGRAGFAWRVLCMAIAIVCISVAADAQPLIGASTQEENATRLERYYQALERLSADDITAAASGFTDLERDSLDTLTQRELYNGAFVFALDNQSERAFRWLEALLRVHRYDDPERLRSDPDFASLHADARWAATVGEAETNRETRDIWLPQRILDRLDAARTQIEEQSNSVWGMTFWDDHILVLVGNDQAYTPYPIDSAEQVLSGLYKIDLDPNEVSFGNTVQDFRGQRFVTITLSDLGPYSDMLIHELFHLVQEKTLTLPGLPVPYLEDSEARTLLRAEYAALSNGLKALRQDQNNAAAEGLADAMRFRTLRHKQFDEGRADTVEMETLEGLANYTGLKLSTLPDKELVAIEWLKTWERSGSYTRTFPYATGPAFGLLMDALAPDWKQPYDSLHDFSDIYTEHLGAVDMASIEMARKRVGFGDIQASEQARLDSFTAKSDSLKAIFFEQPVIIADIENRGYSVSYNMNGTTNFSDTQVVYDYIKATDTIGDQFGNFESDPPQDRAAFGILGEDYEGGARFSFPGPVESVGRQLVHPHYTITLNDGWDLVQTDDPRVQRIEKVGSQEVGDTLSRRAYFGLAGEPAKAGDGLTLTFVDAEATAGFAGLKVGDTLLSVNSEPVSTMAELIGIAQAMRAGMDVSFAVMRKSEWVTLETTVRARPMEQAEGLLVSYDMVEIEGGRSRLITYRPETNTPLPTIFYLPGFSCASIDFGGAADDPIRLLIENLAREGFVVVRQEKQGAGDSLSDIPCEQMTFDQEVEAFSKGVDWIKRQPFVDSEQIFFFGHSLGGVTAPALAEAHNPLGIITYGAPSRRWFEYKLDVFNEQPAVLGQSARVARKRAEIGIPYFRDVMTTNKPWAEIAEAHPVAIATGISLTKGQTILGRDFTFLRTLNSFDVESAWRQYPGNVLALHGSYDVHVISDKDARHLVSTVNEQGLGKATLRVLEGAEHGFSRPDDTKQDYIKALRFGNWTASKALATYDPRIASETARWINELIEPR
ncbi:MAG: prolyl oligopeptidase family serine peptidase [Pseudomonadota bacterium]